MTETIERNHLKTENFICDIDGIIASKMKSLNGYGIQQVIATLEKIYRLKEMAAPSIEIFDEMAKLCWMLKEYTSKTKGKQQQLLGVG